MIFVEGTLILRHKETLQSEIHHDPNSNKKMNHRTQIRFLSNTHVLFGDIQAKTSFNRSLFQP